MKVVTKVSDSFPSAIIRKKSLIMLSKEYLPAKVQTILLEKVLDLTLTD